MNEIHEVDGVPNVNISVNMQTINKSNKLVIVSSINFHFLLVQCDTNIFQNQW